MLIFRKLSLKKIFSLLTVTNLLNISIIMYKTENNCNKYTLDSLFITALYCLLHSRHSYLMVFHALTLKCKLLDAKEDE